MKLGGTMYQMLVTLMLMRIRFTSADLNDCLAQMLSSCRSQTGETMRELANRSGVSKNTVCNAEHHRASSDTMWAILGSFGRARVEVVMDLE